ncbi:hypothetical protein CYLTODRAFT_394659 [Cylindrobasidium torrendii FP15055 ss-10]|uniref:Protein kinase domain-containing protein n=1 Tax=Cylindrobasidium torrendii FP15055 ss-10 TaxID=1314674 RepID=A0A0D7BEJ5_9AGAR|nr:hypothetical protein CYLTODRAFT_394659 [Cylindrobasidium torrendii FP15055 ss-10]
MLHFIVLILRYPDRTSRAMYTTQDSISAPDSSVYNLFPEFEINRIETWIFDDPFATREVNIRTFEGPDIPSHWVVLVDADARLAEEAQADDYKNMIVRAAMTLHLGKAQQPRPIPGDLADRQNIARAGRQRPTPSTSGSLSYLIENQQSARLDALYNHCPPYLRPPPVTLYFYGFRKFRQTMRTSSDELEFTSDELCAAASFTSVSLRLFQTEDYRQKALHKLDLLDKAGRQGGFWRKMHVESAVLDGGFFTRHQHTDLPISFGAQKNNVGISNTNPVHQAMSGYVTAWSSTDRAFIWERSCCPGLIIGSHAQGIEVWGGVFADRFYFQPLATLPFGPSEPKQDSVHRSPYARGIREVAQLLRAVDDCIDDIQLHFADVSSGVPPTTTSSAGETTAQSIFPDWTTVTIDGVTCELVYFRRLAPDDKAKSIFLAHVRLDGQNDTTVVVKFAHTYSIKVHRFLAAKQRAPRLHFCEFVTELQMFVAIMDFVDVQDLYTVGKLTEQQYTNLETAMGLLKKGSYVLGDLRAPNILVSGDQELWIVDFDWAGKEGEVFYPEDINADLDEWAPGVGPGGKIESAHDNYSLNNLKHKYCSRR